MANTILPVQCQYATLSGSGCAIGATTIVLSSFVDINGTNLSMSSFGQKGYGTLEPNNSTQEEQISFTGITQNANGTATLTGVKTVLFITPYTETSAVTKAHPGGSKFIISNTSGLYNNFANKLNTESIVGIWTFNAVTGIPQLSVDHKYGVGDELKLITYAALQSATYAGVVDMTLTAKGIGEEATQAEIDAGTQAGATSAELIVNPKYLKDSIYYTQLPSSDQKAALAGSSGTPSSSNKYMTAADRTGSGLPAGSITMYGGAAAPSGWLLCNGSAVNRTTYADLFTAVSTTYGIGDNSTTFNVPDLRGRAPVGAGTGTGGGAKGTGAPTGGTTLSAWTVGMWYGEETHTVTTAEMPAHTHSYSLYSGGTAGQKKWATDASLTPADDPTSSTGGGGAHNTIQPMTVLSFIIKT